MASGYPNLIYVDLCSGAFYQDLKGKGISVFALEIPEQRDYGLSSAANISIGSINRPPVSQSLQDFLHHYILKLTLSLRTVISRLRSVPCKNGNQMEAGGE
jgi:hypothetical protein